MHDNIPIGIINIIYGKVKKAMHMADRQYISVLTVYMVLSNLLSSSSLKTIEFGQINSTTT